MSKHTTPIVVVDTREQLPYSFPEGWPVIRQALKTGDYSVMGHESIFAIERKSLPDIAGCIFTERFKAELERLKTFKHAFLVIESNLALIQRYVPKQPAYRANQEDKKFVHPNAIIGFLQSVPLLYGVHVLYLDDRETAQRYVCGLLEKYNRFLLNDKEGKASV